MCIAIYSAGDGELLTTEAFNESMRVNDHGMGIAWIGDDGQFKVVKTLHRGDIIYRAYQAAHDVGKDCILHFRKATHGDKTTENCHPFYNGEDEVYVHNGVLNFYEQPDNAVDSALFGERILSHLPSDWMRMPDIVRMIERWLDWSKIIVLRKDGDVTILNESKGVWEEDKGLWYSNTSYRPPFRPKKMGKGKYNLPVKHEDRRSVRDDYGFGRSDYWTTEWYGRETKQEELDLPDKGTFRSIVEDDDPFAEFYPNGYDYQGYEICTYCIPMEWVDAPACYPIFFDEDSTFNSYECCSCTMLITRGSPKRKTVAFDRDTHTVMPDAIENLEDVEIVNERVRR
jgi:hypothetical protein